MNQLEAIGVQTIFEKELAKLQATAEASIARAVSADDERGKAQATGARYALAAVVRELPQWITKVQMLRNARGPSK